MNTTKRLIFGILSSVLLAVGFAKAADQFDPMTRNIQHSVGAPLQENAEPGAQGGDAPCALPSDEN